MDAAPQDGAFRPGAAEQRRKLFGLERRVEEATGSRAYRLTRVAQVQPAGAGPPVAHQAVAVQHDRHVTLRRALQIVERLADDPVLPNREAKFPDFSVGFGEPSVHLLRPSAHEADQPGDEQRFDAEGRRRAPRHVGDDARRQDRRHCREDGRRQPAGQRRTSDGQCEQRERTRLAGRAQHEFEDDRTRDER